jgi:hypothetical protein
MTPEQLLAADQEAADDALEAGPEAIMAGAADAEAGPAVLTDLLAHELAAGHRLMLRLAAAADAMLDWGDDEPAEAERSAAELAAGRLAAAASRLMEELRQGLVALRRFRPDAEEEGIWLALRWLEERCTPAELGRRIAAAKAAKAASPRVQPGDPESQSPALSERARLARARAAEEAAALAAAARVATQAGAAADEVAGLGFLARLFAHELGTSHGLMMRLAGSTHAALDRATAAAAEPVGALRLSAIVARLGGRFRRGLLTLTGLAGGPDGKPRKIAGTVWGGPEASLSAGHGVQRPDLLPAAV